MRADVGIGPYEGLHNRTLNYNLKHSQRHGSSVPFSFALDNCAYRAIIYYTATLAY